MERAHVLTTLPAAMLMVTVMMAKTMGGHAEEDGRSEQAVQWLVVMKNGQRQRKGTLLQRWV